MERVVFFISAKQLRKCASNTAVYVLQSGAAAEGVGEGFCPHPIPKALWVLLSHSTSSHCPSCPLDHTQTWDHTPLLGHKGIEPGSPALQADSLPLSHQGVKAQNRSNMPFLPHCRSIGRFLCWLLPGGSRAICSHGVTQTGWFTSSPHLMDGVRPIGPDVSCRPAWLSDLHFIFHYFQLALQHLLCRCLLYHQGKCSKRVESCEKEEINRNWAIDNTSLFASLFSLVKVCADSDQHRWEVISSFLGAI